MQIAKNDALLTTPVFADHVPAAMFLTRLLCVCLEFLYPVYGSYKALGSTDSAAVERWLMFWAVMGVLGLAEGMTEWVLCWIPFYWEIKAGFIIWLTAPQTQGASYIYRTHLYPFFQSHESDIDLAIVRLKSRLRTLISRSIRAAWAGAESNPAVREEMHTAPPPSMQDPISGPAVQLVGLAGSMWRSHGPAALGYLKSVVPTSIGGNIIDTVTEAPADIPVGVDRFSADAIKARAAARAKERETLLARLASLGDESMVASSSTDVLNAGLAKGSPSDNESIVEISASEAHDARRPSESNKPTIARSSSWFRNWSSPPPSGTVLQEDNKTK